MVDIPSKCIDKHSKSEFSVKEQMSEVVFSNPLLRAVKQITVDGCVFNTTDGKRCDHLVNVDEIETSVLVELKGSDIEAAFIQLNASYQSLTEHIMRRVYWIISYSGRPQLNPTAQVAMARAALQLRVKLRVEKSPYSHLIDTLHED